MLITGFEPFGGADRNPSWEAVRLLPEKAGEWTVHRLCLPVVFGEAARRVIAAAEALRARAVIMTGVAAGRDCVTPEAAALNLRCARIPDGAGCQPAWERIVPDGPDGLFSTLPVREMTEALRGAGVPANVSFSAGTYVCNDVFYLAALRFRGAGIPCGFIHVPGEDILRPEDCARGLLACIACLPAPDHGTAARPPG